MQPATRINRRGIRSRSRTEIKTGLFAYPLNGSQMGNAQVVERERRRLPASQVLLYAAGLVLLGVTMSAGVVMVYQSFADFVV